LRGERPLALAEIASVRVGVSAYAKAQNGAVAPVDTMGAQFSIPYCCALALMGDPADPAMYLPQAIDDADRRRLAAQIEVFVDPEMEAAYPRHYGARIELELANGRSHTSALLDPHGMPADPCTPEELQEKFMRLAGRVRSQAIAAQILTAVRNIDRLPDLAPLPALLRF
jgi:2-methylcitrate dehydratase PrpD